MSKNHTSLNLLLRLAIGAVTVVAMYAHFAYFLFPFTSSSIAFIMLFPFNLFLGLVVLRSPPMITIIVAAAVLFPVRVYIAATAPDSSFLAWPAAILTAAFQLGIVWVLTRFQSRHSHLL